VKIVEGNETQTADQLDNASNVLFLFMHLSMLSCWVGRTWAGDLNSDRISFSVQLPGPREVKKVQIPHSRRIIAGQKNSTNDHTADRLAQLVEHWTAVREVAIPTLLFLSN